MVDTVEELQHDGHEEAHDYEFGGLRFDVSFRAQGATLRVLGKIDSHWVEILRFDDFVEGPHFHTPAANRMMFDRSLGEPLAWYVAQVREHLPEWLERAGFGSLIITVDFDEVSRTAHVLEEAMIACVPEGYVREPGVGLQRVAVSSETS
jgi:hypothetical protein